MVFSHHSGISLMVERQFSKLRAGVRFSYPAHWFYIYFPVLSPPSEVRLAYGSSFEYVHGKEQLWVRPTKQ